MSIGFNPVLNASDAPNTAAFDRADSAISAAVEDMLRNSILLIRRKVNSRRAHDADGGGEGGKL